jgi:hypothetical protein
VGHSPARERFFGTFGGASLVYSSIVVDLEEVDHRHIVMGKADQVQVVARRI